MIIVVLLSAIAVCGIHAKPAKPHKGSTPTASCKPGKPVGYSWNGDTQNGVWYQYMYGPPNFPLKNLTNSIEIDTGLGWLNDEEGTYAQSTITTTRADAPPYSCWSAYVIQNTTDSGFCYGKTRLGGLGGSNTEISMHTFYKMYLDPTFFYLRGYCFPPEDTLTIEKCTSPGISVWTRKLPKDITPLEDRIIRDTLDDRLQMYCMSSVDMVYNPWKYDLPTCPNVDRPQEFLDEARHYQEHLVQRSKSRGSQAPVSGARATVKAKQTPKVGAQAKNH